MSTSSALPPESPADPNWAAPASTKSQASKFGPEHYTNPGPNGQIDMSLPDRAAGHSVSADPLGDQTDTWPVETCDNPFPADTSFRRTTILEEKMNGGYTPNTAPVGEGVPHPTPTPGTRGLADTEALMKARLGQ